MTVYFGDPHIEEKALPELEKIFNEILKLKGDKIVMLGDYYHHNKPTAQELLCGTQWAYNLTKKFKRVIFLRGNHDKTKNISAIDYLKYLGVEIVDEYIEDGIYCGHFMTNKSLYEYVTSQKTVAELKKYKQVILGHQHTYQTIKPNTSHLGSVRFVNFNEASDKHKYIRIDKKGNFKLHILKSPTPMFDVNSIKELKKIEPGMTKVRLIINSFKQFKEEINEIGKWRHKFNEFKVKLNFEPSKENPKIEMKKLRKQKKLKDILNEGIKKIEDEDVRKLLEEIME